MSGNTTGSGDKAGPLPSQYRFLETRSRNPSAPITRDYIEAELIRTTGDIPSYDQVTKIYEREKDIVTKPGTIPIRVYNPNEIEDGSHHKWQDIKIEDADKYWKYTSSPPSSHLEKPTVHRYSYSRKEYEELGEDNVVKDPPKLKSLPLKLEVNSLQQGLVSLAASSLSSNERVDKILESLAQATLQNQNYQQHTREMMDALLERDRLREAQLEELVNQRKKEEGKKKDKKTQYDTSNPSLSLAKKVENIVKIKYPALMETLLEDLKDTNQEYDWTRWTWSTTDNSPYYFKLRKYNLEDAYKHKVALTDKVIGRMQESPSFANKYIKEGSKEWQNRQPSEVLPTINIILEELEGDDPLIVEQEAPTKATLRQIGRAIHDSLPEIKNIRRVPHQPFDAEDLAPEVFKSMYPDTHNQQIEYELNSDVRYSGILTTFKVLVNTPISTIHQYKYLVEQAIRKEMTSDLSHADENTPTNWSIQAYYTAYDNETGEMTKQRSITFWHGTITNDIIDFDFSNLGDNMSQSLENLSYGADESLQFLTLDMTRFQIRRIDPYRIGGGRSRITVVKGKEWEDVLSMIKENKKGIVTLKWGKVEILQHKPNMCFAAALSKQLKIMGVLDSGARYDNLYKLIPYLGALKGVAINQKEAAYITTSLGLDFELYNSEGELVYQDVAPNNPYSEDTSEFILDNFNKNKGNTLRLAWIPEHYILILSMSKISDNLLHDTEEEELTDNDTVVLLEPEIAYYDLETIMDREGDVVPYSNAYEMDNEYFMDISHTPSLDIFSKMMHRFQLKGSGKRWYLCAYNGSKFDHIMLFIFVLLSGYEIPKGNEPNPTGSSHTFSFRFRSPMSNKWKEDEYKRRLEIELESSTSDKYANKIKENLKNLIDSEMSMITVWDPCLYLRKPLHQAATDFKIGINKLGFDHEVVQEMYDKDQLHEWLQSNRGKLHEYNIQDVKVMKLLTEKLFDSLEEITQMRWYEIVKYPTSPGLAYAWWKKILESEKSKYPKGEDPIYKAVSTRGYDEVVRKAITAGRVQGEIGRHKFKEAMIMVDVVSLYPFVMKSGDYPEGEEEILSSTEDCLDRYERGVLGIYYCRWDQSNLKTQLILPTRVNGKLDWTHEKKGEGYVPSRTIDQLLDYGCNVVFLSPNPTKIEHVKQLVNEVDYEEKDKETKMTIEMKEELEAQCIKVYKRRDGRLTYYQNKVVCGICWERRGNPFDSYVDTLADMKNQQDEYASGKTKEEKDKFNPALREMIKMLLNSLSGKVAQRNFTKRYELIHDYNEMRYTLDKIIGTQASKEFSQKNQGLIPKDREGSEESVKLHKYLEVREGMYDNIDMIKSIDIEFLVQKGRDEISWLSWDDYGYNKRVAKPSQLGVFIYANARAYMYDNVFSKMKVWYTDTDSAMIRKSDFNKINEELVCNYVNAENELKVKRKKKFGDYEVEWNDTAVYDELIVLAPKMYAFLWRGKVVKAKYKGVGKKDYYEDNNKWVEVQSNQLGFFEKVLENRKNGMVTRVKSKYFGRSYGKDRMVGVNIHDRYKDII